MRAGGGGSVPAAEAHDDDVLEQWRAHHYRIHHGEIEDPSLGCRAYMEVVTRG